MKSRILLIVSALLTCASLMAEDVIYCRGGLVDVGDWAQNDKYPLHKNVDGIFEGTIEMISRTDCFPDSPLGWGNRVDLFFDFNNTGSTYSCAGEQQFITPANKGPHKLAAGTNKPFQCGGGKYKVMLDWENKEVSFEAIEPAWMDMVLVSGDLEGETWERCGNTFLYHQGDGIYTGDISIVESSNGNGLGYFAVFANFFASDHWGEGRYCATSTMETLPGIVEKVGRYNGQQSFGLVPGDYTITFDMNNCTLRVNTTSDPDLVQTRAHAELGQAIEQTMEEWPDVDLSDVKSVYENEESTEEDEVAAKKAIPGLIRAYLISTMESDATASAPVDATYLITNANYSNSSKGWSGSTLSYSAGVMNANSMDFNHYQTIKDIPNGLYRIEVKGTSRYGQELAHYTKAGKLPDNKHAVKLYATASGITNATAFADIYDQQYDALGISGEADPSGEGWYAANTSAAARTYMNEGRYADNGLYAYVADGTITFGLRLDQHQSGSWAVADDWTLKYYGADASSFATMVDELKDNLETIMEKPAEAKLKEAYSELVEKADAEDADGMLLTYTSIVEAKNALEASIVAYAEYNEKVEAAREDLANNHADIAGVAADLYRSYLEETVAPGKFANGSADYILKNGNLDAAQLKAEAEHIDQMLEDALRGGIAPGTDITNLLTNPDFAEPNFNGWTMEVNNTNGSYSGCHGLPLFPVAGFWNVNSFTVEQKLTDLPNGIYALTFNGYYRTGAKGDASDEDFMPTFAYVGEMYTPVKNIVEDALPLDKAIEGTNCDASDFISGNGTRYPDAANGASLHFADNRYEQTVYGVVTDGTLTIGITQRPFPAYKGGWCVFGNMKVKYMGTADEVAANLTEVMENRAIEMLASTFSYRNELRDQLAEALDMDANDYNASVAKCEVLNRTANEALGSAACYDRLENVVIDLYDNAQNAGSRLSQETMNRYTEIYNTVYDNLMAGTYSDEEATRLADEYSLLANRLIPIMAKGGLQGVGNWGDNDVYLLYLNEDDEYEGVVKFVDSNDLSATNTWWGNRGDLFFKDAKGTNWSCGRPADKFITPAVTKVIPLAEGTGCVFQAIGGDYRVFINMDKKEVRFEPVREFYMDRVFCVGTLKGQSNIWDSSDFTYSLNHTEKGIYKGIIEVEAAEGSDKGEFSIQAAYNSGSGEGRYGSAVNCDLKVGETTQAIRTNNGSSKWFVEPGQWHITFDMNNFTVRLNTVDDPDYEVGNEEEKIDSVPMFCRGGLQDVGNWAQNDKYPLYKNKQGVYEGIVKISDLNAVVYGERWGQRGDLFFADATGQLYGAANGLTTDDKFITPGRCGRKLPLALGNSNVFQAHGGSYKVLLDIEKMEVAFEPVEEKWMDEIYVGGTLVGHRWKNSVADDRSNVLTHQGKGIYQGVMNLEEDNSTLGSFYVKTAYNAGDEGRYTPLKDKEICPTDGSAMPLYRTNNNGLSIAADPGTWIITFDWSHGNVKLVNADDEDGLQEINLSGTAKDRMVGIYTIDGKKVYNGMGYWNTARPGIYIQVTNDGVRKVYVK